MYTSHATIPWESWISLVVQTSKHSGISSSTCEGDHGSNRNNGENIQSSLMMILKDEKS